MTTRSETDTSVKHNEGGAFGIMQINKIAHGDECFNTINYIQGNADLCIGASLCNGKTVLNLDCNIQAGVRYYHTQYQTCRNGAGAYCNYKGGPSNNCNTQCATLFNQKVTYVEQNFGIIINDPNAECSTSDWTWPLPESYNRITSVYGDTTGRDKPHSGVDIDAEIGTPVNAVSSGRVLYVQTGYSEGYGNTITIEHNSPKGTRWTRYSHLSSINVTISQPIEKGQKIGAAGNTGAVGGRGDGSHLDMKVYPSKPAPYQYETPIDPLTMYPVEYLRDTIHIQWPLTNEYVIASQRSVGWV